MTRKTTCVTLSKPLYHKLHVLYMIRKYFFDEKDYTISGFVETAINEYLENHNDEIKNIMEKYHNEGGCADI